MIWRFGEFELDTDQAELRRSGDRVDVEPQVFDVLRVLVAGHGRVVTHRELMEAVWGDRAVGPAALASRVKSARRALGDDGRRQSLIATEHGAGYRFVGAVTGADGSADDTCDDTCDGAAADVDGAPAPGELPPTVSLTGPSRIVVEIVARYAAGDGGIAVYGGATADAAATDAAIDLARRYGARVEQTIVTSHLIAFGAFGHLLSSVDGETTATGLDRTHALGAVVDDLTTRWAGRPRPVLIVRGRHRFDPLSRALVDAVRGLAFVVEVVEAPAEAAAGLDAIAVPPLGHDEVAEIVRAMLGGPVATALVDDLVASGDGTPARIRDLVSASRDAGSIALIGGEWTSSGDLVSPDGLAGSVPPLSEAARRAAEMLTVAGALPVATLTQWCGASALDQLDDAGLIAIDADGRVRLASSLVRAGFDATLSGLARHRIGRLLSGQTD